MKTLKSGRGLATVRPDVRAIADGEVTDLSDWSDEELLEGRRKDKDGRFRGGRPKLVPREFSVELTRRRMQRSQAILAHSLVDGAKMLQAIINDPKVGPRTKLRAIEVLFNRVLGRPRETVSLNLGADAPDGVPAWQKVIATAIVGTAEQAKQMLEETETTDQTEEVIEGEIVEDEPEPPSEAEAPRRDAKGQFVKRRPR